jgi:hypothetical protein
VYVCLFILSPCLSLSLSLLIRLRRDLLRVGTCGSHPPPDQRVLCDRILSIRETIPNVSHLSHDESRRALSLLRDLYQREDADEEKSEEKKKTLKDLWEIIKGLEGDLAAR